MALCSVKEGMSIRKASASCHLPSSTFYRQYRLSSIPSPLQPGRPPALLPSEENTIVYTLIRFADRDFPLNRERPLDCVSLFCEKLPAARKANLPFKNCRPTLKLATAFAKRHMLRVKFGKPSFQEWKRFACTNAVNLVSYATALAGILKENNIDKSRIANIDETGFSPDRDRYGSMNQKVYGLRGTAIQSKLVTFEYWSHVTLLPTVFASGDIGSPLWIIKGDSVSYRAVVSNSSVVTESFMDCLRKGSVLCTREDNAGVDHKIFVQWSRMFVESVSELTSNGRKVLLLYDAYRSHMSLQILEILETGGVIAFALPAHTSGTNQPLDLGLFQPFKNEINRVIDNIAPVCNDVGLDIFDLGEVLKRAYEDVSIPFNVRKAFTKAVVHPFNPQMYLSVPRSLSEDHCHMIVSVDELKRMLKEKQEKYRQGVGVQAVTMKRGFVDMSGGLQLTSVMTKVAEREAVQRQKIKEKADKVKKAELKWVKERRKRLNARSLSELCAIVARHRAYGDAMVYPRSLELRRKLAREMTTLKEVRLSCDEVGEHDANGIWNECSIDQTDYPTP